MKGLYKMHIEYGRDDVFDSLFIADYDKIDYLLTHEIGIHFNSEVDRGALDDDDIELVTTDEHVIKIVEDYDLENGYNPIKLTLSIFYTYDWKNTTKDEEIEVSDEFIDKWDDDYTVEEFIDYRMAGKLPDGFKI